MQKTAYVMRISDWSSDVCSSDLAGIYLAMALLTLIVFVSIRRSVLRFRALARDLRTGTAGDRSFVSQNEVSELTGVAEELDRKGVVKGKRVSVRVTLGGCRILKQKTYNNRDCRNYVDKKI